MKTEITQQQMKTVALAAAFVPYLRQIVELATVAEAAMASQYAEFISDVKLLCAQFPDLCRAGCPDKLTQRFNHSLYLCVAVQKNAEQKPAN